MKRNNPLLTVVGLGILYLTLPTALNGQNTLQQGVTEVETDETIYRQDLTEEEAQSRVESLQGLSMKPVNINSDGIDELSEHGLISELQLYKLKDYRFKYGNLLSINELKYIDGWNDRVVNKILPFIRLEDGKDSDIPFKKPSYRHIKQDIILHAGYLAPKSKGYMMESIDQDPYQGAPWRIGLRYDLEVGKKIQMGLRLEKDPGEPILPFHAENALKMNYPDYVSGYALLKNAGFVKSVCLGDFHIRFGRGLTISTGGGYHAWKDPFLTSSSSTKLRQNTSMAEYGFFRGMAFTTSVLNFSLTGFYSTKKKDVLGYQQDPTGSDYFTSISESGYHRDVREISSRGRLNETSCGGILAYRDKRVQAGLVGTTSVLSMNKQPSQRTYMKFQMNGKKNITFGGFAEIFLKKSMAYLELSLSGNQRLALVAGVHGILTPFIKLALNFRYLPVRFQPGFYARGPGPYGSLSNETGINIGLEVGLPSYWTAAFVMDFAMNPWLSYQSNSTNRRYACHGRLIKNTSDLVFHIAYTFKQADENMNSSFSYLSPAFAGSKHQADLQLVLFLTEWFRYKNRFGLVQVSEKGKNNHYGGAIQQEVTFQAGRDLKISMGSILFNTTGFASRIYIYEPDVLYSSGNQSFYGRGIRSYLLVRWSAWEFLDFWIKAGVSILEDVAVIGSGKDEIKGNKKVTVNAQVRIKI